MRSAMAEDQAAAFDRGLACDRPDLPDRAQDRVRPALPGARPGDRHRNAEAGDIVTVHYAGRLLNGAAIDSSYQGGAPLTFRIGEGHVIAGWEEAIRTMKKGEKRTLIIPYWLAYGAEPAGHQAIPPSSTLVFEVELLDFR